MTSSLFRNRERFRNVMLSRLGGLDLYPAHASLPTRVPDAPITLPIDVEPFGQGDYLHRGTPPILTAAPTSWCTYCSPSAAVRLPSHRHLGPTA